MLSLRISILFFTNLFLVHSMSTAEDFVERRYQRLEIGNSGRTIVRDFKIVYGELTIPHGTNFREMIPMRGTMSSRSVVVAVPESAEASWTSGDGIVHRVSVPIKKSIRDPSSFYGWKFYFADDHLDVYRLSKKPQRLPNVLELDEEKIFP